MTAVIDVPDNAAQLVPIPVGVNLLPEEVIDARRGKRMRTFVAGAMIVVVGVLAGGYVLAAARADSAQSTLTTTQDQSTSLLAQQNRFHALVQTKARSAAIRATLTKLSATDVNWATTLGSIESAAPHGLTFTSIAGTVATSAVPVTGATATSGATAVAGSAGTLTITGTTADKATLAQFVDNLAKVTGVSTPLPTSATSAGRDVTFAITAALTKSAFSSRYSTTGSK